MSFSTWRSPKCLLTPPVRTTAVHGLRRPGLARSCSKTLTVTGRVSAMSGPSLVRGPSPLVTGAGTLDRAMDDVMTRPARRAHLRGAHVRLPDERARLRAAHRPAGGRRYEPAPRASTPDVVVFNTCAVRENADNKLYGNLGHLAPTKKQHPGSNWYCSAYLLRPVGPAEHLGEQRCQLLDSAASDSVNG